jgi:2'-5' RNA ligase
MRCFVALLPAAGSRSALDALLRSTSRSHPLAHAVHPADLHLTLAFIGELPEQRALALAAALAQRSAPPAPPWQLDQLGAFARARVLWAGGPPHAGLESLAAAVRAWLDDERVSYDRKRFVPHVTLLRKLAPAEAEHASAVIEPPIAWPLGTPVLLAARASPEAPRYAPVGLTTRRFGGDQAEPNP